jgi:outer membrane cobalamin receptor
MCAWAVPGVRVERGGGLAGGVFIHLRGTGSFIADLSPDIYLDGVRIDGRNTGAAGLHVLELLPAESLSRIRVFKGASSGGPAISSANGAIWIETVGVPAGRR